MRLSPSRVATPMTRWRAHSRNFNASCSNCPKTRAIPRCSRTSFRALAHAATVLTIPTEHRVLFFHTFGRHASKDLAALYDALNTCFIEHRILANLRAPAVRIRRQRATPAPGEAPPHAAAAPAQAKA